MKITEVGVRKPITTAMLFAAIVILGLVSLTRLGLDLMPKLDLPTLGIITNYPGAGPEEVEKRITQPIEDSIATISGLDSISSVSQEGVSVVMPRFTWGHNLEEAANDIRDKVGLAEQALPDDAGDSVVFKFDLSMIPILMLGITADESYPQLYYLVEKNLSDPLKRIPGVATTLIRGGQERVIHIDLDLQKLEAYQIPVQRIVEVLRNENLSSPGGNIKTGQLDYLVRTPEEFRTVEEIGKVVVASHQGRPVYLRDLAGIRDGFSDQTREVYVNREKAILLMVQKQAGENTVTVAERVKKELPALLKNFPPDVKMHMAFDTSADIVRSIGQLRETVLWGGLLVILVILLFLRNFRSSLIVALSLPTSLIVCFIFLYLADYTINVMSLSSMAIAIGMVVDDSIVVLENIFRHRERKARLAEAAIHGTDEVSTAVVAATLTIVVIFVPLIFVGGITGILFRQLAFVISIAMLASLFSALLLVPMLTSKLLRIDPERKGFLKPLYNLSERIFSGVEEGYRILLDWALRHRKTVIIGAVVIFVVSLGMLTLIGTEFIPASDEGQISFQIELPEGTRMEETEKVTRQVEKIFSEETPEISTLYTVWGAGQEGMEAMFGGKEGSNTGEVGAMLVSKKERDRSPKEIAADLRPKFEAIPGAVIRSSSEDPLSSLMFGGGKPISVEIRGYDLDQARVLSQEVTGILASIEGVTDVDTSRKEGRPELQVDVDREKASQMGLNVSAIGGTVEYLVRGKTATKYREGGDEFDINVRLREEDRDQIEDLERLPIFLPTGQSVRLANVAVVKKEIGPISLERADQERVVTVSADLYRRDLGSVVGEFESKMKGVVIPPGFSVKMGGAREEQQKSFRLLFLALLLGSILVYMVMASQFESFRDPFIIIFSVPFGVVGVIWSLLVTRQTLSVISLIGMVMLVGIVVKNGIVLIDYINILRARRLSVRDAVTVGGKTRLRPVLMTTVTTIFGLLPMALSSGEGSEQWRPLAISVIGGLLISTLITLVFIPTLYAMFEERKAARRKSLRS